MAFTVPENVNVETAQGEVIQAMRRLRRIPAGKEKRFRAELPGLHQPFMETSSPARWDS